MNIPDLKILQQFPTIFILNIKMIHSLVLATTNSHKLKEILQIWDKIPFDVLTLKDFPEIQSIEENGNSFAENALIKARTVSQKTGLMAIADDSGLEVDALKGAPGIYSARFAAKENSIISPSDEENLKKVLEDLRSIPVDFSQCRARFRSVAALVTPAGKEMITEGVIEGLICGTPRGTNGFGYDPIFMIPSKNKTFAEIESEEKNRISHRTQAFLKMKEVLLKEISIYPAK